MDDTRENAHNLIDRLPDFQLYALVRFLETLVDPVAQSLRNASVEGEPVSAEEAAALDEAHASIARGEGISHEEVLREFGLAHKS